MDVRLLSLFAVLTVAVELGRRSELFDALVARTVRGVRSARGLASALVALTGVLAMFLTNDVALFLVVPFTMLFAGAVDFDLAPLVVLEIASANLIGALTPIGNPQNLFLFTKGRFTPGEFVAAQAPLAVIAAVLLAAAILVFVPASPLRDASGAEHEIRVDRTRAAAFALLLAAEVASLFRWIPHGAPLLLALGGAALLGRRLLRTDFSLVLVFALLYVGVAGLERGRLYATLDPARFFGSHERGLFLSGAFLSQLVSNVPAAILLAPAAVEPSGFRGLLRGVTAGGCGTPIASIASLIGAQLYFAAGPAAPGRRRRFWGTFLGFSGAALAVLLLAGIGLSS